MESYSPKNAEIINLYLARKLSVVQISEQLNLSVSTVRYVLDRSGVQRRSISEAITNIHITRFKKPVFQPKKNLSVVEKQLQIAGIMLYWGEGAKTNSKVCFVNSDPEMIKVFLRFLREICGIAEIRLKAFLHIYTDQNEEEILEFWSLTTGIPKSRFYKSFIHTGAKGTYNKKSLYGTISLSYSDKRLLECILLWIQDYKNKCLRPE